MKYRELSKEEYLKLSGFEKFAYDELRLAGMFDEDSDYNGAIGEAVMQLIHVLGEQSHSGVSFYATVDVFKRLAQFKPLEPLTGKKEEWKLVDEEANVYQNVRCYSVFKNNVKAWDIDADNPSAPIEFPYKVGVST